MTYNVLSGTLSLYTIFSTTCPCRRCEIGIKVQTATSILFHVHGDSNLIPAKDQWCFLAGNVTADLTVSNDNLSSPVG